MIYYLPGNRDRTHRSMHPEIMRMLFGLLNNILPILGVHLNTFLLMKTFPAIAILACLFLIACGDNKDQAEISSPSTLNQLLFGTDTTVQQTTNAGVALNPKHGEPGHRCDIAVGAPLNSPATIPNSSVVTPPATNVTVPTTTTTTTTTTAGLKFNPKHGEPGHRCDLAEGAPLDGAKQ